MSWHLIDEVRDFHFQLPLSGSHNAAIITREEARRMLTFNSLSRDHWLIGAVDDLATIHDSFNSLSRDHERLLGEPLS